MAKVKAIDRSVLKNTIRPELGTALEKLGKKWGLKLSLGNIRFSEYTFTAKIEAELETLATDGLTKKEREAREALKRSYSFLGLKEKNVNGWFKHPNDRKKYQLVGYNNRAPKYPFIIANENGSEFIVSREYIKEVKWL